MIVATTQGLGPFYAKIIFNDFVYICDQLYSTETEAHQRALSVLNKVVTAGGDIIRENDFHG